MSGEISLNVGQMASSASELNSISTNIGNAANTFNGEGGQVSSAWEGMGREQALTACKTLYTAMVQVSKIVAVLHGNTSSASSVMQEVDSTLAFQIAG